LDPQLSPEAVGKSSQLLDNRFDFYKPQFGAKIVPAAEGQ